MSETQAGSGMSAADLLRLVGPRWVRPRRLGRIPDQPIVHAVRETAPGMLADQLSDHLATIVPHAELHVGDAARGTERERSVQVRTLLDTAVLGLREHDSWPRIGRLQFPRYALTSWLLKQNLRPAELNHAPHSNIRDLLHDFLNSRRRPGRGKQNAREAAAWTSMTEQLPWYLFLLSLVAFPFYYALWVRRGKVPRWFLRQQYLAPRESADFPSFVRRLITTPSERESAEQVRRLLVHAFLSDLSDSHSRRLWRWRWVPKDCYPVLLLKDLRPGTIGETLVRLVNNVRNETGARDPLLVVATGEQPLEDGETPRAPVTLEQWERDLQAARRKRSPTAWYVPLRIADEPADALDYDRFGALGRAHLPLKRSKLVRRTPLLLVLLLLVGSTAGYAGYLRTHCGQWWPYQNSDIGEVDGECIRVSDTTSTSRFFSAHDARMVAAQEKIAEQNEEAERRWEDQPNLPHPTVVYFSTFPSSDDDPPTLAGIADELDGVAVMQRESLGRNVLMKVVLANGGLRMKHGPRVAADVAELVGRDDSVVAVAGLGGSWQATVDTIEALEAEGVPMVGTTISADLLSESSPLFYQVAPSNAWEAKVVANYIAAGPVDPRTGAPRRPDNVLIYSNPRDLYSHDLAQLTAGELRARGIEPMPDSDRIPCGKQNLVFFAGRANDLATFLTKMPPECGKPENYPQLLAGDDTSKLVLDDAMDDHEGVVLDHVSFTGRSAWDPQSQQGTPLRGRGLLARDALEVIALAVQTITGMDGDNPAPTQRTPVTGGTVWRGIGKAPFVGSSGTIDYGAGGQIPVDKSISILRVTGGAGTPPEDELVCGRFQRDPVAHRDPRCPVP
ncbi:hypothetical protein [Saccharopolyspora erythraea]|uniref:hypothetical protein n=1 Tax=Saccharopolyspora erythraea TaxID=1836 RepID=UPI00038D68F3|nr:hypothetical protein [Saccharopolyspora erythraea]EQD84246.1 hypothetical protein N599_21035 [Saccharopolyspora erythraea D]QRK88288.1 hypothetical protein JQX30_26885 [Saccharopolyspora erythraea]